MSHYSIETNCACTYKKILHYNRQGQVVKYQVVKKVVTLQLDVITGWE